ncbi:hypothetical protein [Vibrio sp.]|uniref:hypothetical protein n=1 Tax=Vibrio sp. TaxID=678 RepID=UPI003F6CE94B
MKYDGSYLSPPDAIWQLFKVRLSEHKAFKDLVYPLIRSKEFLNVRKEPMGIGSNKHHLLIDPDSLIKFYNAVLLQGFFSDSKRVKDIFTKPNKRLEAAEFLELIVSGKQSILGLGMQNEKLSLLIVQLRSDAPQLTEKKLPNPFNELPQLSLGGMTSVMQVLLAQSATLTQGETMMTHFLNDDLEKAYQTSLSLTANAPILLQYQAQIQKQYLEATEFDNLLDSLLN